MLESLLFTQGRLVPKDNAITFKTSGSENTAITTSKLGSGFTTQYSIDGSALTPAGTSFNIPAGDHEVTLKFDVTTGTVLNMESFKDILTEVLDWEGFKLSCVRFNNCTKLTKVPDYLPVSITNMGSMFNKCSSFNQDIGNWDTSKVTSMNGTFYGCVIFNQPIGDWDTGHVTDMGYMFYGCSSFNQDIGNWDTSKVTNMIATFQGCTNFNQDIGNWGTGNVTVMNNIFQGCTNFNQNISTWNVNQVTNISGMFYNCTSFNQDLSSMIFKSTVTRTNYDYGCTVWNAAYRPKFTG